MRMSDSILHIFLHCIHKIINEFHFLFLPPGPEAVINRHDASIWCWLARMLHRKSTDENASPSVFHHLYALSMYRMQLFLGSSYRFLKRADAKKLLWSPSRIEERNSTMYRPPSDGLSDPKFNYVWQPRVTSVLERDGIAVWPCLLYL